MKINEMIKKLRIENNYTQEQIANLLGVSTPAVNKWKKGISYPDITFLPALARILNTDLNTLLSFKDDLSNIEIATFLNQISDTMKKEGFEFMGWAVVTIYEDNSFSYHLWNSTDRVTKDTKLTARWRKTSNKITFMSADGKVIKEFRKPIIFN